VATRRGYVQTIGSAAVRLDSAEEDGAPINLIDAHLVWLLSRLKAVMSLV
jgi:hypothetical protein